MEFKKAIAGAVVITEAFTGVSLRAAHASTINEQLKPASTTVLAAEVPTQAWSGDAEMITNHIVKGSEDFVAGLKPGVDYVNVDPMHPGKIVGNTTQSGSWYANSNNPFKDGREFERGIEEGYKLKRGITQQIVGRYCTKESTQIDVTQVSAIKILKDFVLDGNTTVNNKNKVVNTNTARNVAKGEIFFQGVIDCSKTVVTSKRSTEQNTGEEVVVIEKRKQVTDDGNIEMRLRCANGLDDLIARIRTKKRGEKPVNIDVAPTSTTTTTKKPYQITTTMPTTTAVPTVTIRYVPPSIAETTIPVVITTPKQPVTIISAPALSSPAETTTAATVGSTAKSTTTLETVPPTTGTIPTSTKEAPVVTTTTEVTPNTIADPGKLK